MFQKIVVEKLQAKKYDISYKTNILMVIVLWIIFVLFYYF